MRKLIILSLVLLSWTSIIFAHDFVVNIDGQSIYFTIKNEKNRTAEVSFKGSITDKQCSYFEGELVIPPKVKHNDVIYTIIGVGPKAFSGADKLSAIVLPSTITYIADFAFEKCSSLVKIIFPGNQVTFGEGVFFLCDKIRDISLGSDWKDVNLKMFSWSDSLSVMNIPAKIERIQNLKYLKNLQAVIVDVNNSRFSDHEGVLYDKAGTTLYACPRAYEGKISIMEGVKTIQETALIDCLKIEEIDFSRTVEKMSFRELGRMKNLKRIIFRSVQPIMTAQNAEKEVFLLQVANRNLEIIVPREALKTYKTTLVKEAGDYKEINKNVPYSLEKGDFPSVRKIIGVKNFSKYE